LIEAETLDCKNVDNALAGVVQRRGALVPSSALIPSDISASDLDGSALDKSAYAARAGPRQRQVGRERASARPAPPAAKFLRQYVVSAVIQVLRIQAKNLLVRATVDFSKRPHPDHQCSRTIRAGLFRTG
jgi:hypothetical protein